MRTLGSPAERVLFSLSQTGHVRGVRLVDGREVVIKIVATGDGSAPIGRLEAVHRVQSILWDAGFPCPRPLVPPTRLGAGLARAEELVDVGECPDAHDADVRSRMAAALAWQIEVLESTRVGPSVVEGLRNSVPAWIDLERALPDGLPVPMLELAALAAEVLVEEGRALRSVIGHADWEVQNMRFAGREIAVVYDWDSVAVLPEAVLVGMAASVHAANVDWSLAAPAAAEERGAFVAAYEAAAGCHLSTVERRVAAAAGAWVSVWNGARQTGDDGYRSVVAELTQELRSTA